MKNAIVLQPGLADAALDDELHAELELIVVVGDALAILADSFSGN
jgi:hypothetical protein